MVKQEFLDILKECLLGELPPSEVSGNIKYYDEYILNEEKNGNNEAGVLEKLGDPRLIARTIIDSYKMSRGPLGNNPYNSRAKYEDEEDCREGSNDTRERNKEFKFAGSLPWYYKVFFVLVIILILSVILAIGGFVLSIGLPILAIFIVISIVLRGIRR